MGRFREGRHEGLRKEVRGLDYFLEGTLLLPRVIAGAFRVRVATERELR